MKIRFVEEKDRENFVKLASALYLSAAVHESIPVEHHQRTFDLLMKGTPFADGFVFEEDCQVVGYGLIANTWSNEAGGRAIWIEEIFVLPEYRARGIATAFIQYIRNEYGRDAAWIRLEVSQDNPQARKLYTGLGFEKLPYEELYLR